MHTINIGEQGICGYLFQLYELLINNSSFLERISGPLPSDQISLQRHGYFRKLKLIEKCHFFVRNLLLNQSDLLLFEHLRSVIIAFFPSFCNLPIFLNVQKSALLVLELCEVTVSSFGPDSEHILEIWVRIE